MTSRRVHREQLDILREAGAELLEHTYGGRHLRAKCLLPGGRVYTFTLMGTPGDTRSMLNFRAQVKRAVRGEDP